MRLLCVSLLALALCACDSSRLSATAGALYVDSTTLTLPEAFVGSSSQRALLVSNASRSPRTATLAVTAPFALDADAVEVPGGAALEVPVRFVPTGEGAATGTLQLTSGGATVEIALSAVGRVAPVCLGADPCRPAHFDPVAGACVEAVLPDGTSCQPESACLEGAQCVGGQCVGSAKSCDDDNVCTADACSEAEGCLHVDTSAQCPAPTDACHVATCDPKSGCGLADAPDGTPCGPIDCVTADICLAGSCRTVAVPDGMTCAPETPCQGEGVCQAQQCVQPAAAPLTPVWRRLVPDGHTLYFNGLADAAGNVYWVECSSAPACELISVTRSGFERYRVALAAPAPAWVGSGESARLVLVNGLVVSGLSRTSVEARHASDGSLAWRNDLLATVASTLPGDPIDGLDVNPVALVEDGRGGLYVHARFSGALGCFPVLREALASLDVQTGAVLWTRQLDGNASAMAADEPGNAYVAGSFQQADGGYVMGLESFTPAGATRWLVAGPWTPSLSVASGQLAVSTRLWSTVDGTLLEPSPLAPDLGAINADGPSLLAPDAVYAFGTQQPCCPTCACPAMVPRVLLRSTRRADAWPRWDAWLSTGSPADAAPFVSEGALTADGDVLFATGPGPIYRVTPPDPPALQAVTPAGTTRFSCQLPDPAPYDAIVYGPATALTAGRWTTVESPQCFTCNRAPSPAIVSFDVKALDLAAQGWPTAGGSNRRAGRPR